MSLHSGIKCSEHTSKTSEEYEERTYSLGPEETCSTLLSKDWTTSIRPIVYMSKSLSLSGDGQ